MELNQYILKEARINGICAEWATLIDHSNSKDELMEMYVKGIDFCLEHDFPSNQDLLKLGGPDFIAKYGVYVNQDCEFQDKRFLVLLGACKSKACYTGYSIGQVYLKGTSSLSCDVAENAFIIIDCFDETSISVNSSNDSKVLVNLYGNAKIMHSSTGNGMVKIVHKNKSSY